MTNTKFRKRALLSSVAMLLVALVALGSATFAWFTENPNAEAHGIAAYANTSKGLLISTDTDTTPSHSATLSKGVTGIYLAPATTNNGTAYYTIDAAASNNFKLDTAKTWTGATMVDGEDTVGATGTGVYQETMKLQMTADLTGDATQDVYLKGVTITLNNNNHKMKDALVVTIKYGDKVKHFSQLGNDVTTWKSFTGTPAAEPATTGDSAPGMVLTVDESGAKSEKVGTFNKDTKIIPVEVYVWLNGQNSAVYTDNSDASQLIQQIKFDFSLNA